MPTLTRWLQPAINFETAGIGSLKLRLIPAGEPSDEDGVPDHFDNCVEATNSEQDDTDGDGCGNLCDADPALADRKNNRTGAPPPATFAERRRPMEGRSRDSAFDACE